MTQVYENAIRNTAKALNVDADALAKACEDGNLLSRLISAAFTSACMLRIDAEDYRANGEHGKATPNEGQADMIGRLYKQILELPRAKD